VRITFSPRRSLEGLTDSELRQLVTHSADCPELLFEIFWEASERELMDLLGEVREAFWTARDAELEAELFELDSRREEIEARIEERQKTAFQPSMPSLRSAPAIDKTRLINILKEHQSWLETAAQVRHSQLSDLANLDFGAGYQEWQKHSPMNILGYSVGKRGLPTPRRHQFLQDFALKATLPVSLPTDYLREWGAPGTPDRVKRMVRHIAFHKFLRSRDDARRYRDAIIDWGADLEFLKRTFASLLTPSEWTEALRVRE